MAEILCGYTADRDETLVAYLYGEIEPAQRSAFEGHIATCDRCRHELEDLQGVRGELGSWKAPDRPLHLERPWTVAAPGVLSAAAPPRKDRWRPLREIPAWAQAAAAMLVLGVSLGIANLDVRYDTNGLSLHTGWSRPPVAAVSAPIDAVGASAATTQPIAATNPWRTDLDALERRLRTEFHTPVAAASPLLARDASSSADAQLLRKVKALLDDSERKQKNEIALRIAEVVQEFDMKRGSDLANIRTLRNAQAVQGIEVLRNSQYMDLLRQASLQK